MTPVDIRRGRTTPRLAPGLRTPVRQGRGPTPRLRLPQGAAGLPRPQERRADRHDGRPRRRLGAAEVPQLRPLALRRRPGRGPGHLRRRLAPSARARRPGRRHRRRVGLRQAGHTLRRRGAAAQRPARQGGQLPGRRLPARGHPRGDGTAGPPALPARGLVRGHARGARPPGQGAHPAGGGLPAQAPDGRRAGPRRGRARGGRAGLGRGRRGVRQGGEFLDAMELLGQRYVVEVPQEHHGVGHRPGAPVGPQSHGCRRWPRWPPGCRRGRGGAWRSRPGAKGPLCLRVRRGAGLDGAGAEAGRPAGLAADPTVAGGGARGQVSC